ncbi:MAG: S8 family serine peptidase [Nanoarchaeota archaeon]|nr:S8 family serine peptidase [Nanoarchaeota archaeon]MBU1644187.1 S8 family serine peptidase [Nanoarchaeota archaeon]MBU1977038.1 S8 family serine peptidase [Nanoarchaeota archaeon]
MKAGRWLFSLVLILLVISLISVAYAADIDPKVTEAFENGDKEVSVVVILKDDVKNNPSNLEEKSKEIEKTQNEVLENLKVKESEDNEENSTEGKKILENEKSIQSEESILLEDLEDDYDLELKHKFSTVNGFSAKVTEKGIENLKNDPNVDTIIVNGIFNTFLTGSTSQIGANTVWNLSVNGYGLTGTGQTVCVLDTGIDTDHSAFAGRILAQHCYCSVSDLGSGGCCPDTTVEDDSSEDDNGHGTHVSGIVAGNHSTYRGVAPGAGIVVVKICNSAGSCNTDDAILGLEWCINNADTYNISVISMSLGGGGPYNSYCNDVSQSFGLAPVINNAVKQNISVIIAAGNNGFTNGISSPACVENATPVGAVNSGDSITYNRGLLLKLLAPGVSITAPYHNGGTATMSGTSMATPHVSGTALLLQQFNRLQNSVSLTPLQVEQALNNTGKMINDSGSGLIFQRVNIYSAILSIDDVLPSISFVSPTPSNGSLLNSTQIWINITSSETLQNATLEWSGVNESMLGSGTNFYVQKNLSSGNYSFRVYGTDFANNTNVTTLVEFVVNGVPNIIINVPSNNNFYNNDFYLNVTVNDDNGLSYSSYNLTNSSGDVIMSNVNNNISGTNLTWNDFINISNSTFIDGNYTLTIFANDTFAEYESSSFLFTVDKTAPLIFAVNRTPGIVYHNSVVLFQINVTDNYLNASAIYLESNFSGTNTNYTLSLESGNRYNFTVTGTTNLTNGNNISYRFYALDNVGNVNSTDIFSFIVQNRVPTAVTVFSPANGTVVELRSAVQFTSSATDPDDDSLTYRWNFNDGTSIITSQNTSHIFNTTGTYVVILNVSDSYDSNFTNITLIVNDTTVPTISASFSSETHLERDGGSMILSVTASDLSGIFNLSTLFNGSQLPLTSSYCSALNRTARRCIWNISFEASDVGTYNFIVNATDNSSNKLINSTNHSLQFTSCFDGLENGDETDTDCGGSCSACSNSSSSSSSSSSSGGGGGGSSSSSSNNNTITTAAIADTVDDVTSGTGSGSSNSGVNENNENKVLEDASLEEAEKENSEFSQKLSVLKSGSSVVNIDKSNLPIKKMTLKVNADKEITVSLSSLSEKPAEVSEVKGVYKYLKIDAGLTEKEIDEITVEFEVSKEWLFTNKYSENSISFDTFEDGKWKKIKTRLIDSGTTGATYSYEAKIKHFSYFAISAGVEQKGVFNSVTGWISALMPSEVTSGFWMLIGLITFIAVLSVLYLLISRD